MGTPVFGIVNESSRDRNSRHDSRHTQGVGWDHHALTLYLGSMTIPSGDCAGELMQVLPWEHRLIRGACGCTGDVALSISVGVRENRE